MNFEHLINEYCVENEDAMSDLGYRMWVSADGMAFVMTGPYGDNGIVESIELHQNDEPEDLFEEEWWINFHLAGQDEPVQISSNDPMGVDIDIRVFVELDA